MISTENTFPTNKHTWVDAPQAASLGSRSCLFNLIIYTDDPRRASYFLDMVRLITAKFPCRIIYIWSDTSSEDSFLRVRQAVKTHSDTEHSRSEELLIESSKDCLNRVPFVILPYFIADVPIYLFWGQDPTTENAILPHLQKFATRLIFDSESCEHLHSFSEHMIALAESGIGELTDMNWARTGSWRDVLAQAFDTPERIQQLSSAKQITIEYNSRPSDLSLYPMTQALYLQAWLASQLKWELVTKKKEERDTVITYRSDGNTIRVILRGEVRKDVPAQEILKFEAEDPAIFLVSLLLKAENQVVVHWNTLDRCELPFTVFLPGLWSGKNFIQEIFYKKSSNQYFRMLRYLQ